MSAARANSQLAVGPMELERSDRTSSSLRKSDSAETRAQAPAAVLRNSESEPEAVRDAEILTATILDDAFKLAGLDNKVVAAHFDKSVSLIEKWRKADNDSWPNFHHIVLLGPKFHLALLYAMSERTGLAKLAYLRVAQSMGNLAIAMGL